MRIAVLVKQIPKFEEMELTADGRLRRDGIELEMNPYCRRAVAKSCELAGERPGSTVTVLTLGPPAADDTLREAIAWGLERGIDITGVHVTDVAFAGSDTLATARALAAASDAHRSLRSRADRPQLGRRRHRPGRTGAGRVARPPVPHGRALPLDRRRSHRRPLRARRRLAAGRGRAPGDPVLCRTPDRPDEGRPGRPRRGTRRADPHAVRGRSRPRPVGPGRIADLRRSRQGDGHRTGAVALARTARLPNRSPPPSGTSASGARSSTPSPAPNARVPVATPRAGEPVVGVVVEPDRAHATRELIGAAAGLGGRVVALTVDPPDVPALSMWGADEIVHLDGSRVEEDIAHSLAVLGVVHRTVGRAHLVDRVRTRGRRPRGRVVVGRTHRRRGRSRRRRWPPRRVEARVRWATRRRDLRELTDPDGDGTHRHAPDARTARTRRHPDPAHRGHTTRPSPHPRPHPGRRHRRARRGARGDRRRHGGRAGRVPGDLEALADLVQLRVLLQDQRSLEQDAAGQRGPENRRPCPGAERTGSSPRCQDR